MRSSSFSSLKSVAVNKEDFSFEVKEPKILSSLIEDLELLDEKK